MHKYRLIKKLGEGTFSEVFKAQNKMNQSYVAIKIMKKNFGSEEEVNNLREVNALKKLITCKNIIKLLDVIYEEANGRLSLVFELFDKNLYEAMTEKKTYLPEKTIKSYCYQLLKALDFMHKNAIFHRDIKPENILLKDDHLVLADFGSCKGIYSKPPYTEYISTRWYRPPECILTHGHYNLKIDMWGVGCVLYEIITLFALFPGDNEIDQMIKIQNVLGPPSQAVINQFKTNGDWLIDFPITTKKGTGIARALSHVSPDCIDLINKLLCYNPEERLSAKQALQHPFFKDITEQDGKLNKMSSFANFNTQNQMKSFINDSLSIIKSTDESQIAKKATKKPKISFLPNVKQLQQQQQQQQQPNNNNLLVYNEQHSLRSKNDSDDYSDENVNSNFYNNQQMKIKLPKLGKGINDSVLGKMKTMIEPNNINSNMNNNNNARNTSLDMQSTQNPKSVSMSKKMHLLKKNYISPYSQKYSLAKY